MFETFQDDELLYQYQQAVWKTHVMRFPRKFNVT